MGFFSFQGSQCFEMGARTGTRRIDIRWPMQYLMKRGVNPPGEANRMNLKDVLVNTVFEARIAHYAFLCGAITIEHKMSFLRVRPASNSSCGKHLRCILLSFGSLRSSPLDWE